MQESIHSTVDTAAQPILEDVRALTKRICEIEAHYAKANAEGDQQRDHAWSSYDDHYPDHPSEPSWAERAAKVGKGASGQISRPQRSTAGAGNSGPAAKSASARPAAVNPCKLRVSTPGGDRLKYDDVKLAVCNFVNEANPPFDFTFGGGIFG